MKNEVKKKMIIDSRKSRHQSHDERISSTNVNYLFALVMHATPACDSVSSEKSTTISISQSRTYSWVPVRGVVDALIH